jgi:hypothetical protein
MNHTTIGKQIAENTTSGKAVDRDDIKHYISTLLSDLKAHSGTLIFGPGDDDFVKILTGWPRRGIMDGFTFNSLPQPEGLSKLCQILEDFAGILQDEQDCDRQVVILAEAQSLAFYTIGEAKEWREHNDVDADIAGSVGRAQNVCNLYAARAIAGAETPSALAFFAYRALPGGITTFLDWKYFYQALERFVEVCPASSIGVKTVISMLSMQEEMVDSDLICGLAQQCLRTCALPPHLSIIADGNDGSADFGDFTLDDAGLALTTSEDNSWGLEIGDIKTDSVESVDVLDGFDCDDEWSVKLGKFLDQVATGLFSQPIALRLSMKANRLEQIGSRPELRQRLKVLMLDFDSGDFLDTDHPNSLITDNSLVNENEGFVNSQTAPSGLSWTDDSINIEGEALDQLFAQTLDLFLQAEVGESPVRFGA